MQPSLLELCDHARRSCTVNGLAPKEWRWGQQVRKQFEADAHVPSGYLPITFQSMRVFPMKAEGVACIGKKPYVSLLEKKE